MRHPPVFSQEQMLDLIDVVQSMPRSSPKTTGVGGANMPLFIGMQPDPDGAWIHWYDVVKELRRMVEENPQPAAVAKAEGR